MSSTHKACPRCFSPLSGCGAEGSASLLPAVLRPEIQNFIAKYNEAATTKGSSSSTTTTNRKGSGGGAVSPQALPSKAITVTTADGHEVEITVELSISSSLCAPEGGKQQNTNSSRSGNHSSGHVVEVMKQLIADPSANLTSSSSGSNAARPATTMVDELCVPCLANHLSNIIRLYGVVDLAYMREKHVEGRYTVNNMKSTAAGKDCNNGGEEEGDSSPGPNPLDDTALGCGDDVPVSQQRYSTVNNQWLALNFSFQPSVSAAAVGSRADTNTLAAAEITIRLVTKVSTKEFQDFHPAEWFSSVFNADRGANSIISALFGTTTAAGKSCGCCVGSAAPSSQPPSDDGSKKSRNGKKGGKKAAAAASEALDTPTTNVAVPAMCGICEEEIGAVECIQCDFALCEGCLRSIHSKGKFKSHTIVPLGTLLANKPAMCPEHPDQELQLFCHDCGVPVCVSCMFSSGAQGHKGHQATPLQEEVNRVKKELKSQVDKLQAGAKYASALSAQLYQAEGKLDDDFKGLSEHIHESFNRLRTELNKRESFLCDRVSEIHSHKKLSLTRNAVVVQALCSEVDELHASCLKATDGNSSAAGIGSNNTALSGSKLLNIAPMIEARVSSLEQHRVLAEAFRNFGSTPLPPSLVNSPAASGGKHKKKANDDEEEEDGGEGGQRSSATENLNQQLALWAKQYTPSLEDLSFRLRPDGSLLGGEGGEAGGRDSTISTTSSALLSTMEARGDQAFADLISKAGELSYYPEDSVDNQNRGGGNDNNNRDLRQDLVVDLTERPFLTPTAKPKQEEQQQDHRQQHQEDTNTLASRRNSGGLAPQSANISNLTLGTKHQRQDPVSAPLPHTTTTSANNGQPGNLQQQEHYRKPQQPMFNFGAGGGMPKLTELKIAMTQNPSGVAPLPPPQQAQPSTRQQQQIATNNNNNSSNSRSAPLPGAAPPPSSSSGGLTLGGGGLEMPQWGGGGGGSLQMPPQPQRSNNATSRQQQPQPQEQHPTETTTTRGGRKSGGHKKGGATYKLNI